MGLAVSWHLIDIMFHSHSVINSTIVEHLVFCWFISSIHYLYFQANARPDVKLHDAEVKVHQNQIWKGLRNLAKLFDSLTAEAAAVEPSTAAAAITEAPTVKPSTVAPATTTDAPTVEPSTAAAATTKAPTAAPTATEAVVTTETEAPTNPPTTNTEAVVTTETEAPTNPPTTTTEAVVTTETEAPTAAAATTTTTEAAATTETTEQTTVPLPIVTSTPQPRPCEFRNLLKDIEHIPELVRKYVTDITSDIFEMESEVTRCISPLAKKSKNLTSIFNCNIPKIVEHFIDIPIIHIEFITNLIAAVIKLTSDFSSCF